MMGNYENDMLHKDIGNCMHRVSELEEKMSRLEDHIEDGFLDEVVRRCREIDQIIREDRLKNAKRMIGNNG